jgi:hypothetical protein
MNPYAITGPALISFSGGRTSAFMLWNILQAHGGTLPGDVHVVFANTGKEREETLRFVHECETHWGVRVNWVERRPGKPGFDVVGYNSAARNGEPFEALIRKKKRLPNWKERWCTADLKVEPMTAFARSIGLEPPGYKEVIGLRFDEQRRLARMVENNVVRGRNCVAPLAKAEATRRDVMDFWSRQPFGLGLQPHEGNCDLCFLKAKAHIRSIMRDNPHSAHWWVRMERETDQWFDRRTRYATLRDQVREAPDLFVEVPVEEHDAECGLLCGVDE